MAAEKADPKGQAWFCTTGLASDVVIEVGDMNFHLHKFPLMYRSKKLHFLVTEAKTRRARRAAGRPVQEIEEEDEEEDDENSPDAAVPETDDDEDGDGEGEEELRISLPDFPGGTDAFEAAAKFCYGGKIELTPANVVPLRCAAEFLEMTDDVSQDNLVSRTERYLVQSVLRSLRESVRALRSCDDGHLLQMAEDLGIVQRCVDSIAVKASASDPASLFGWPMGEGGAAGGIVGERRVSDRSLWSGLLDGRYRRKNAARAKAGAGKDNIGTAAAAVLGDPNAAAATPSWFEDLTALSLPLYKRVIGAMKAQDMSPDVIEGALISYARRCLPGLSRTSRKSTAGATPPAQFPTSEEEQAELLETIVTNLPLQKTAASSRTTTRFLFGLLRAVKILGASEDAREVLERKIGMQLEHATLDDLLMPSYSYTMETLYDVDCVERLLAYFLEEEGSNAASAIAAADDFPATVAADAHQQQQGEGGGGDEDAARRGRKSPLILVGRLIDGFLSEIASDINLKPDKFCSLAFALPEQARVYDDGLYRAVDIYLKAHPRLSEAEKERICGVMDCQKLTLEACTHAAQNERLPLRAIVQVLFFEQLQLRHAIAGSLLAVDTTAAAVAAAGAGGHPVDAASLLPATARSALRDNQVLRLDMDTMRTRVQELEKECSTMKKAIEKIDKSVVAATGAVAGGDGGAAGWRLGKKFGCKFRTQVCDSHERNIVEARRCSRQEEQSTA